MMMIIMNISLEMRTKIHLEYPLMPFYRIDGCISAYITDLCFADDAVANGSITIKSYQIHHKFSSMTV